MNAATAVKEFLRRERRPPERGEYRLISNWQLQESGLLIDEAKLGRMYDILPDHIIEMLNKSRDAQIGKIPLVKAGLGYEELLNTVVADGTAIASSSTETRLIPAIALPANYLTGPSNTPGRTFKATLRGRATTLTTAATMTMRWRDGLTDALTTALAATGAITMDATAQTNTMWLLKAEGIVRAVGSGGSIFCMGDSELAAQALTIANNTANFLGSAGSAAPAAVAIDTTVAHFWNFTAQWSLTTAYSIQCHEYLMECLN